MGAVGGISVSHQLRGLEIIVNFPSGVWRKLSVADTFYTFITLKISIDGNV
jgi:hypothetical protein